MQKAASLPLRRLAQAAKPHQANSCRPFSTSQICPIRLYQCTSPLTAHTLPRSPRSKRIQWQPVRSVYTTKTSTLRERMAAVNKESPVMFPLALLCIFVATCGAIYTSYYYITIIQPIDNTYPAPIATKLKRALYYTNQDPQPQKAFDYYRQALALCEEHEIHPFSAEVMGIKLKIVYMLEKTNHLQEAVEMLEKLKSDGVKFVEYCDGRVVELPAMKPHRTRVLHKTVQMSVKLGDLYTGVYTRNDALAEKHMTEGLEMLLKETQRREAEKVTDEEEGSWMSNDEIGAAMESLADMYEKQSKHHLSAPLYLRAITMAQPPTCHTSVLMNNLAASLVQTSPERPVASSTNTRNDPPTSRPALISNARQWTEKSLEICQSLKPPERTEECDEACAVATHNLGEFAEMEGMVLEARKRYEEARGLAKVMGFSEGVQNADEGLKRLSSSA